MVVTHISVLTLAAAAGIAAGLIFFAVEIRSHIRRRGGGASLFSGFRRMLRPLYRSNPEPKAAINLHSKFGLRRQSSGKALPADQIDYAEYRLSTGEMAAALITAGIVWFLIGYVFYGSTVIALVLSLAAFAYPAVYRKKRLEKRKNELADQFKQALFSLSASLTAGKSVENAFQEVVTDLRVLYPDSQAYIIGEFERINMKIRNGDTVEHALRQFSGRADSEDIRNFADVFMICNRSGGNLVEVIHRTAQIIGEKTEIKREIAVMLAQKRFESKLISMAPIVVVAMLSWSSPDYMAPLYHGTGRIIMSVALLLLLFCYWLTLKIMDIKV